MRPQTHRVDVRAADRKSRRRAHPHHEPAGQAQRAQSRAHARRCSTALRAAEADESVRSIVLTGAGPAFCAGADLSEFKDLTPDKAHLVEQPRRADDEPAWHLFAPVEAGRHRHQRRGHGRRRRARARRRRRA